MLRGGLTDNRKFIRAVRLLREELAQVVVAEPETVLLGLLGAMWLRSANASSQQLDLLGDEMDVEARCGWRGAPGRLVEILESCAGDGHAGFIERRDDGLFYIHDFYPNAPRHIKQRLERATDDGAEVATGRRAAHKSSERSPRGAHAAPTRQPSGAHTAAERAPDGDHVAQKSVEWAPYQSSAVQSSSDQSRDTEDTPSGASSGGSAPPRQLTPQQARVKALEDWFVERGIEPPKPGTLVAWLKHAKADTAAPVIDVLASLHSRGTLRVEEIEAAENGCRLRMTSAGIEYVHAALRNAGETASRRSRAGELELEDERVEREDLASGALAAATAAGPEVVS